MNFLIFFFLSVVLASFFRSIPAVNFLILRQGGDFQWVSGLGSAPESELYDGVDAVLSRRAIVRSINPPAGSVFFFNGAPLYISLLDVTTLVSACFGHLHAPFLTW